MAVGDGFGEVDELAAVSLGVAPEQLEGALVVDAVDGHENAFGAFDRGAAGESALEVVVLGEAAEHDLECRLQLLRVSVGDVGEDAAFGSLV